MKTRTITSLFILVLVAGLLLTGCGSSNRQIVDDELTSVTTYSAPAVENILTGMENFDYETFSADFSDQLKAGITAEKFDALAKDLQGKLGAYQSHEVSKAEEVEGGFISVSYKTKFEKATITVRLVHEAAEPHLVSGLWFQ
jgi:major membrane immunogen (membrane-anchored lipoprotein)